MEEGAYILIEEVGRRGEAEWIGRALVRMENGDAVYLVAEVDDRVIMVKRGYRRIGIGTELVKTLIELAKEGFRLIYFPVFEKNIAARRLYSNLEFKEVGGYLTASTEAVSSWI